LIEIIDLTLDDDEDIPLPSIAVPSIVTADGDNVKQLRIKQESGESLPVKRGRGRPRKENTPQVDSAGVTTTLGAQATASANLNMERPAEGQRVSTTKRRRGRPTREEQARIEREKDRNNDAPELGNSPAPPVSSRPGTPNESVILTPSPVPFRHSGIMPLSEKSNTSGFHRPALTVSNSGSNPSRGMKDVGLPAFPAGQKLFEARNPQDALPGVYVQNFSSWDEFHKWEQKKRQRQTRDSAQAQAEAEAEAAVVHPQNSQQPQQSETTRDDAPLNRAAARDRSRQDQTQRGAQGPAITTSARTTTTAETRQNYLEGRFEVQKEAVDDEDENRPPRKKKRQRRKHHATK